MSILSFPSRPMDIETKRGITGGALDILLPLHVVVGSDGKIESCGRTFRKLVDVDMGGDVGVFDVLKVKRPGGISDLKSLLAHSGEKLTVHMAHLPGQNLKAVAATLPEGGCILDLSLGAGVLDVVAERNLMNKDFSPADPTVEMIYMMEVQSFLYQQHKQQSHRLQGAKAHAEAQAYTDALTGLANRRALEQHLKRILRRASGNGFAVMQIDLDFFKAVNDTHGHAAGDYVLQHTARTLLNQMRVTDMVARIGGDEFVVVLSDYGSAEGLAAAGQRIIDAVEEPIRFDGVSCEVGASIGATIVDPSTDRNAEDILADADRALYASKDKGRGMYHLDRDVAGTKVTKLPN